MKPNDTMDLATANRITGGLSNLSKMPCPAYSTSTEHCVTGSKMRDVEGSVCSVCYVHNRGNFRYPNVKNALEIRYQAMINDPMWSRAMAYLIRCGGNAWFRWFGGGDIPSVDALRKIAEVCNLTPDVKHWLPTREYGMVSDYINSGGVIPKNLTIRLSAIMLDGVPPTAIAKRLGVTVSGVSKTEYNCPASTTDNKCGECRACWDKKQFAVTYKQH